jgi:hypothetical protein
MLTEHLARDAAPKSRPYKLSDFAGFYLLVTPRGSKLRRVKYRLADVEKCISLGIHPAVSLSLARQRRDRIKAQLRSGIDPMQVRRAERSAELRRQWRPEISFSLSEAGELMIATRTVRMRLSVPHTNALRGYLLSQPETPKPDALQPDTVRLDHAAQ